MLVDVLRARGFEVVTTREPGGTALGQRLREAFLETEETVAPMAELLAFAADRAQNVEYKIKPALKDGKIVISDRYADATFAYQGAGRGFPEQSVNQVINFFHLNFCEVLSMTQNSKTCNICGACCTMFQH